MRYSYRPLQVQSGPFSLICLSEMAKLPADAEGLRAVAVTVDALRKHRKGSEGYNRTLNVVEHLQRAYGLTDAQLFDACPMLAFHL